MTRLSSPDVSASLSADTVQRARKVPLWSPADPAQAGALPRKDDLINGIISASIFPQLCDNVKREQENKQSIFISESRPSRRMACREVCFVPRGRGCGRHHGLCVFGSKFHGCSCWCHTQTHVLLLLLLFYGFIQIRWLNSITLHNHNPDR